MLTVNELINMAYIPVEEDISLQLLVDFYEQYLCKRIFKFTLKNGAQVKLAFNNTTEIFHVSGIDHIYEGTHMNATRFVESIKAGKIDMAQLKAVNASAYRDYLDRIRSFACIDMIIKNCEYLLYADGAIPDTNIKVKYLLLRGMDSKNIHLGIDSYREGKPFFIRTLLVTGGNSFNKFIDRADERLRVSKIEIIEKATDNLIELIDRDAADRKTCERINDILLKWENNHLKERLEKFYTHKANESKTVKKILDIVTKNDKKVIEAIRDFLSKRSELLEILSEIGEVEGNERKEWEKLLAETAKGIVDADAKYKFILRYCFDDLVDLVNKNEKEFIKQIVMPEIKSELEGKRQKIKDEISNYDKYWAGKIVGEQVRKEQKEYFENRLRVIVQNQLSHDKEKYSKILLEGAKKNYENLFDVEWIELICSQILSSK